MDTRQPNRPPFTQLSPPAPIDEQFMLMANTAPVLLVVSDQVSEILLNSELKYSKQQNKIEVHLSEDTKSFKASVIDFGIGIDTKYLRKIFDRFYRIPGEQEETFQGLGIGLFISDTVIHKHGGKISAESFPGKEIKFNFEIPVFNQTL